MGTKSKRCFFKKVMNLSVALLLTLVMLLSLFPVSAIGTTNQTEVVGNVYEFDKNSHYEFHETTPAEKSNGSNTYGSFFVSGDITTISEKSGVPCYEVANGNLAFFYNYTDTMLNADKDSWHLVEDKSKKVADITLDSNIMMGTIILQTSRDRMNWVDAEIIYNAFSDTPIRTSSIYSTSDVQLINGCFYRVIVVYELSVRTEEGNILFVNTDKYDYKKCAEVYEFYAYTPSSETTVIDPNHTYRLGTRVKVKNFDGYFGEELIDAKDLHYGWELGNFFVSGYTDEIEAEDGNIVFLKNVGDKVTLWFNLKQNINVLNGQDKLSITADTEGYDQYFETPKMDFGRGVLIIRYTDHNNVKTDPIIYTNYLEANTAVGADTKVQLFEEGDYEVALNYEVTNDGLIDKVSHYRIFFKFSVRNSNCMVYPFDVKTGSELTNSSLTANGFRLDLAKSRYLKINIKREVMKESADGLIEDTRFNGLAKDGAEYTEEGIYTITVSNQYTGATTTKKIYVGTNNVLRAYMVTGLSIAEINALVADGATIRDDGTIQLPASPPAENPNKDKPTVSPDVNDPINTAPPNANDPASDNSNSDLKEIKRLLILVAALVVVIGVIIVLRVFSMKRNKPIRKKDVNYTDVEGGAE